MAKRSGKGSDSRKKGKGSSGEKSFFKVDDSRAMKAKKNKAFVKFNKAKVQVINQKSISRLNHNLESLQTAVRTTRKEGPQFVNPVKEAREQFEKISDDLEAAIDKLSSASLQKGAL